VIEEVGQMAEETWTPLVLVVVDDTHLRQGIGEILELEGYEVATARNGLDGLDLLCDTCLVPDLIVSDIVMGKMNGYEFFAVVRAERRWAAIPFVFLSDSNEISTTGHGLKSLRAVEHLTKPFAVQDLLSTIRRFLSLACAA
jgi:CheY-like chemotaxis protein